MKLNELIELLDLCAYIPKHKTIIFGDVHLGYEESLSVRGVLIPRQQYGLTIDRLTKTLDSVSIETIVISGDLKHEFGTINYTEKKYIVEFIKFLQNYCKTLVIIEGNHDPLLKPLAKNRGVVLCDYYSIGDSIICHGDSILDDSLLDGISRIIIGHEHPAITLSDYPRKETYKCALFGKYNNYDLLVLPSYNLLVPGTNVLTGKFLSPYLKNNKNGIDSFKVFIVGEEILNFGTIKEIKKM